MSETLTAIMHVVHMMFDGEWTEDQINRVIATSCGRKDLAYIFGMAEEDQKKLVEDLKKAYYNA